MTALQPDDFPAFFDAVHGMAPHRWQVRLAERVCTQGWPDLLDLPTGSGKTAALDIALFALAVKPSANARRVVFVVDRRLIVDQVAERAELLSSKLADALNDGPQPNAVLTRVALALNDLSWGDQTGKLLGTSTLRGGVRDVEWAKRPDKPWIISSTVDQVGSRLLFRGYGVSASMSPVHAGMLGNDALFLLDEVHLSRPFAETLREIADRYRPASAAARPWKVVEMSATPGTAATTQFGLDESDFQPGTLLHTIVNAHKPTRLVSIGAKNEKDPAKAFAADAVGLVASLGDVDSVCVVVNRVATARAVADALALAGERPIVLTGRMRPYDRRAVINSPAFDLVRNRGGLQLADAGPERPVLVATQTIEVGADLDFGGMITECAPIDSLRQRFGRLDRSGARWAAGKTVAARIVLPNGTIRSNKPEPDPVYGAGRLQATWNWLKEVADATAADELDVGIGSPHLQSPPPHVVSEQKHAPLLLQSHLDALVQTAPAPKHSPDVARWLHGEQPADTDVSLAWRSDFDPAQHDLQQLGGEALAEAMVEYLALVPITADETLSIPLRAVARWLDRLDPVEVADVPTFEASTPQLPMKSRGRRALRVDRERVGFVSSGELRPGDTLVVPSDWGGIDDHGVWSPESASPVPDVGGLDAAGTSAALRLLPEWFPAVVTSSNPHAEEEGLDPLEEIRAWDAVAERVSIELPAGRARQRLGEVLGEARLVEYRIGAGAPRRALMPRSLPQPQFDGSDEANSFIGREVTLSSHLLGVGAVARQFADACGLDEKMCGDLELAGRLHDLGKIDPRFQIRLHGNDVLAAAMAPVPLAKSAKRSQRRSGALRPADQYPRGHRHELLSLALIDRYPELLAGANDPSLVRYLVASHHGHNRPFVPHQVDARPASFDEELFGVRLATDAVLPAGLTDARSANLFWELVERWGYYGLAWLEALFRLADHRRSEAEAAGTAELVLVDGTG